MHLPTSQEGRYSQSLERGLAILRAFTPERTWMGIAEIAEHLEMSRPTTHRYASTLVALNYLEQGRGRKYRLGMRAGDPGRAAIASTSLRALPSSLLAGLRDRSGCTASLAVLDGADVVYVDRARSARQGRVEVSARIGRGSRLPARETAMGRVLLAGLSEEELRAALEQSGTGGRGSDLTKLMAELEPVRNDGFVIAPQLHVADQLCVAAPILDRAPGAAIAAVEVACATDEHAVDDARERLAPLVCETAREMSEQLGRHRA
ncbi:MAG TPA: IclR family transcriptional regulator [Solirubrobacteraceae bacterium]|nr:IclR family transcriptional regulator [Solirubrobacteraceae bacterium]